MYLYVIECFNKKYYIGSAYNVWDRINDHRTGRSCKWTAKHGFKRVHRVVRIPEHLDAQDLENDIWVMYASIFGAHNVRGGDVVITQKHTDIIPGWLLPTTFGGQRIVDWGLQRA